ncbi:MAG: hypothetical protein E7391_03945 [Ruminococcaceae bacterium]|nr:hypothetical protein [Oscillospiraceae bacterium]
MQNKNGVILEMPSVIDYDYEVVCGAPQTQFPNKFSIDRKYAGKVKNQGNVGSCVAMVISSIAEVLYRKTKENEGFTEETDLYKDFSEGWVYGALRNDDSTAEGMIVSNALEYWRLLGSLPSIYFDMLYEMPDIKKVVKSREDLYKIAKEFPIGGYVALNYADKERRDNTIKDALTKYGYGLLAVSNNYFGEGHCIMLTGWDDENDKYEFKNSWGENYRDKGFGYIPKDKVNSVYLILMDKPGLKFTDVSEDKWYFKPIRSAVLAGIVKGVNETSFEPDRPVTRAEFTQGLLNVYKKIDEQNNAMYKSLIEYIDRKVDKKPV